LKYTRAALDAVDFEFRGRETPESGELLYGNDYLAVAVGPESDPSEPGSTIEGSERTMLFT
jgi:hypothetical protein